jgi:GMP synthase PP-ATPase subunit
MFRSIYYLLPGLLEEGNVVDEQALLEQVNNVVRPHGCEATDLGPDSVGVQGDARAYGPSVYVTFPEDMSPEKVSEISTEITNRVRGITRVLRHILYK